MRRNTEYKEWLMALDRAAIRKAGQPKRKLIEVEEWGGEVYIRSMLVRERQEFIEQFGDDADNNLPADVWLVLKCVVDENGDRLFGDDEADVVLDMAMSGVQRVGMACLELNGLSDGAVEEAEGN